MESFDRKASVHKTKIKVLFIRPDDTLIIITFILTDETTNYSLKIIHARTTFWMKSSNEKDSHTYPFFFFFTTYMHISSFFNIIVHWSLFCANNWCSLKYSSFNIAHSHFVCFSIKTSICSFMISTRRYTHYTNYSINWRIQLLFLWCSMLTSSRHI